MFRLSFAQLAKHWPMSLTHAACAHTAEWGQIIVRGLLLGATWRTGKSRRRRAIAHAPCEHAGSSASCVVAVPTRNASHVSLGSGRAIVEFVPGRQARNYEASQFMRCRARPRDAGGASYRLRGAAAWRIGNSIRAFVRRSEGCGLRDVTRLDTRKTEMARALLGGGFHYYQQCLLVDIELVRLERLTCPGVSLRFALKGAAVGGSIVSVLQVGQSTLDVHRSPTLLRSLCSDAMLIHSVRSLRLLGCRATSASGQRR